MRRSAVPPVERAENFLPQIDSILCGPLSGKEAEVIREGESILRELKRLKNREEASIKSLIENLERSIMRAKEVIADEK